MLSRLFLEGGIGQMKGLSVYLSQALTEDDVRWIEQMKGHGFTSVFTSLHIPEDDASQYTERLQQLGALAKRLDLELIADIAPTSLAALGKTWDDAETLLAWGVTGLRVDYGVTAEQTAHLSRHMTVALNASTLTATELDAMRACGLQIERVEAWHNFYPRPETGLDTSWFQTKNDWLHAQGIRVQAFIPGDGTLRGPLFEGLPTLEAHRGVSPFASYLELESKVDRLLIGDPRVSDATIRQFEAYADGVIRLRATATMDIDDAWRPIQTNRLDPARDVIRSVESRSYGQSGTHRLEPLPPTAREVGAITVDNVRYGRYAGELQIVKRALPADERVNVIGHVRVEDRALLAQIGPGTRFQIEWE